MKELIEVDVVKLTKKHIERTKTSMKPDTLVISGRQYEGKTFELCYTYVNGKLEMFTPDKQCRVTVGRNQFIMSNVNFAKLKPKAKKEKAIDKPKKNK